MINRDMIGLHGRGIVFDKGRGLSELHEKIDSVKTLLSNVGANKGDLVTIAIMEVDLTHIASIFACGELGLRIFILDSPATRESLPFTKLALHGPSDYYLYSTQEDTENIYNGLHDEMLGRYGGLGIDATAEPDYLDFPNVEVLPTDPFLVSSTSGTTGPSKPITFSHQEVYDISKRNINVFWFGHDAKVVHSRNLHHASAILTHLFPALMNAYSHSSFAIGHDLSADEDADRMVGLQDLLREPPSNIMIPNKEELYDFLETFGGAFRNTVNINMCGFVLDEEFVDLAREYNVCFQSHFGSIDTAIPLFINRVDKDSIVIPNSLGVLCDDFYKTTLENGRMKVEHPFWDAPRYIDDDIEIFDGQYILMSSRDVDVNLPDGFDISPFFQDTKINYEQLRGHLNVITKRV